MARAKGSLQKNRNESKYWLPEGIKLKEGQTTNYNKETKLWFTDPEFGEFQSYFKAIQQANASTHPLAVQKRREATNIERYGGKNPSTSKDVRKKAQKTMEDKYGVSHALLKKEFLDKSRETLKKNHGVDNPMNCDLIRLRQQDTVSKKYGCSNPMKNAAVRENLKRTLVEKYGVDNVSKSPEIREKILENLTKENNIMSSSGEEEIKQFVRSLGLECYSGYIGGADPKQIDIKIKGSNVAIEYHGCYWHSEANKNMYPFYHRDKMIAAKNNNLRLIQIFDFEWDNRKDQVKSFLRSALKCNTNNYYARNTTVREIDQKTAKEFLDKYHIIGSCNFIKAYGLVCNEELLALLTIGRHHRDSKKFVLNRFVVKENVTVVGGLSKLCSAAKTDFNEFTTWIDLRWSDGDAWINSGWKLEATLKPDYFYWSKHSHKIFSKQSRAKKQVNTPVGMTEHQHALNDGLLRVYDCGKIRLVYK